MNPLDTRTADRRSEDFDPFPPERRRCLIVSSSRNQEVLRGAEKQVILLAKGLLSRGWDVMLGAPRDSKVREGAHDLGMESFDLDVRPEFSPLAFWKLRRTANAFKPLVLHLNDAHALSMGMWARLFRQAPLVVAHRRVAKPPRHISKYTMGADGVVAISESVRKSLVSSGCSASRTALAFSCVDERFLSCPVSRADARKSLGIPEDAFVFTMIGAMVTQKDHPTLLTAFGAFRSQPNVMLYLVGDGSERRRLERQALQTGLGDRIRFPGTLEGEALLCAYRAADTFVFSTHMEGLGLAAIEAQAMGLPIIASDVPGLNEAVAHGRTGLLVPPQDVNALTEAMMLVRDNADLRAAMTEASAAWVSSKFTENAMVEGVLAAYRRFWQRNTPS
jgi:glycosyltransferase involved in cell wall biosynthesis